MSSQYHKIQTIYKRDPETKYKTLLIGDYAKPEFGYLANCKWRWTEKLHGMNMRIMWDGEKVTLGGRTDNAQIHAGLVTHCHETFHTKLMEGHFGADSVTLFGEGVGPKIQKGGGRYFDTHKFILFDVRIGDFWLESNNVYDIVKSLSCYDAPLAMVGTLEDAVSWCRREHHSAFQLGDGGEPQLAEGLVGRPLVELTNRYGERVITKIKRKDFM